MKHRHLISMALIAVFLTAWALTSGNAQVGTKKKTGTGTEEVPSCFPCKGPKKRIAVYRFKDGVNNSTSSAIRDSLVEALQHELQQTGCFIVLVTNEDLQDAATEIRHGQSGMGNEARSPQAGNQLGAQGIFQGTLMEIAFTQGEGVQTHIPNIGMGSAANVGFVQTHAKVVIQVKMFDPETRILLFSERAEGEVTKRGVKVTTWHEGAVVNGQLNQETPLGDAAMRAVKKAVCIIVDKMNAVPWQATILKVTGNQIIVRAGSDSGIQVGQILNVYKPGEKVEDPDTGEMIQLPPTKVGQAKVTQVIEKFIYAEIISGPATAGMWVRVE